MNEIISSIPWETLPWEAVMGLCTMLTTFGAVLKLVLRINTTLASLEEAVEQLRLCLQEHAKRNELFGKRLEQIDLRLTKMETRLDGFGK